MDSQRPARPKKLYAVLLHSARHWMALVSGEVAEEMILSDYEVIEFVPGNSGGVEEGRDRAETVAQQVSALEDRVRLERTKGVRAEQKFERVVGMLLRGEKVCIRCWMHEAHHVPGPPTPPHTKGHLGATEDSPAVCDDFLELTRERWEAGDGTGTAS